eukprot:TRINITY_DN10731_c0_g1_i1.p1 TRINITY_DN10731_c0_g1~~TRINITY_DN10731_c0_g1_i1.p1  ORF type:complete len:372 (-),score=68.39 TRINITY_DN10731_c0_g1_i1:339-1454(-)
MDSSDGLSSQRRGGSQDDLQLKRKGSGLLAVEALQRNAATITAACGKYLHSEFTEWRRARANSEDLKPINVWERAELRVKQFYDGTPIDALFRFIYDLLQLSSGRDKLCCILQNACKILSARQDRDSERYWMYRASEDSLSDGRKIFRFFKEFREVYKIRRGFHRMSVGIADHGVVSIPATCGLLDVGAHIASFFYYTFDQILWCASVGLLRSKEVPKWQREMWHGARRNGKVISFFNGVSNLKRQKNQASIMRIMMAFLANVLLLRKAIKDAEAKDDTKFQGPDDARLFHSIELLGMAASFRDLLSRLGYAPMTSQVQIGGLGILAAMCGLWTNWRKVKKDQFGTKKFQIAVERRQSKSEGNSPVKSGGR